MDDITSDISVYKFVTSTFNGKREDPQPGTVVPDLVPWSLLVFQGRCHSALTAREQIFFFSKLTSFAQLNLSFFFLMGFYKLYRNMFSQQRYW